MAIHIMELNGKINNVVFYTRYGKNFARSKPRKYKRTNAMKVRSRNFGIASSAARIIRMNLYKLIPFPKNKQMQSRFSSAVTKWIGSRDIQDILPETDIVLLNDFQFNEACRLQNRWKLSPVISNLSPGLLQLQLPAFTPMEAIIAPEHTVSVTLQVGVVAVKPGEAVPEKTISANLEIPFNDTQAGPYVIDLPVKTERGTLIITACALQFNVTERGNVNLVISDKPDYMPAAVVDARYC